MTAFSLIMRILILSTLHKVYQLPGYYLNSLGSGDAIWPQRSGSTLAQAMACCLRAPNHYLNNVDLSSVRSSDIHLRAGSQEIPQPSITEIICKIKYLKFHSNFPGANELNGCSPRLPATWLKPHQPVTIYRGESQGDNYSHESYRKTSNISCIQSQNWNVSHLILQLS